MEERQCEKQRVVSAAGRVGTAAIGWIGGCALAIRNVGVVTGAQITYILVVPRSVSKPVWIITCTAPPA